jgi:hypothetical protein
VLLAAVSAASTHAGAAAGEVVADKSLEMSVIASADVDQDRRGILLWIQVRNLRSTPRLLCLGGVMTTFETEDLNESEAQGLPPNRCGSVDGFGIVLGGQEVSQAVRIRVERVYITNRTGLRILATVHERLWGALEQEGESRTLNWTGNVEGAIAAGRQLGGRR